MQTLKQLQSGELKGSSTLKLDCGLTDFPMEILELADSLEVLDLSGNALSVLPATFSNLKKLRIVFFADNQFAEFPSVLADCPELEMIGFKSNRLSYIPEHAFPVKLRWLILTNNAIQRLPASIGQCHCLQKAAFAGNQLRELPIEMAQCKNLELLRISANQLSELPAWLLHLPRLSWLAYAGNPCSETGEPETNLKEFSWNTIRLEELLGQGASGVISRAILLNESNLQVAVKVFKGEVTSDGLPQSEMKACVHAGAHPNLVPVLGKTKDHPEHKDGLVLELIPPGYKNLGNPPSLVTCSRDTYPAETIFKTSDVLRIAKDMASVSAHLHHKGLMHGDLYAHNIMIHEKSDVLLGDFGAATLYRLGSTEAALLERLEVRAFGCLLEDLLQHTPINSENQDIISQCNQLKSDCMQEHVLLRPDFAGIHDTLLKIS